MKTKAAGIYHQGSTWKRAGAAALLITAQSAFAVDNLEKQELKFGFIKLTDCAPDEEERAAGRRPTCIDK